MKILNVNIKQLDMLNDIILDKIYRDINYFNVDTAIDHNYFSSFYVSICKINLKWVKKFLNYDIKKRIFVRSNNEQVLENYLVCYDDIGNFYQNKDIKVFEKYCANTRLVTGFILPVSNNLVKTQLNSVTKSFHKFKLIKAKLILPKFTYSNAINFTQLQNTTVKTMNIDILNQAKYYEKMSNNKVITIDDIVHPNAIILNENGIFNNADETDIMTPYHNFDEDITYIRENVTLVYDKSFIWYIKDSINNNIILCGYYNGQSSVPLLQEHK